MAVGHKVKKRKSGAEAEHRGREKDNEPTSKPSVQSNNPSPNVGATSRVSYRWLALRFLLVTTPILGFNVYYRWQQADQRVQTLISAREETTRKFWPVECSSDYVEERKQFPGCVPQHCGRVVMDGVVTQAEAQHMLRTAKAGLSLGGSNGGASILDLHSGALSKGDKFVNIYTLLENNDLAVFNREDFSIYRRVKEKMQRVIASEFGVAYDKLYLTKPMFFSRMTSKPAQTVHDEYWQLHIDREQYGSFHYTSLLYLTDYGKDFEGGRFVFVDEKVNSTVEPRLGRVSFFTSGSENPHYVEKVESGVRYAITVPFTCDPKLAISTPTLEEKTGV